MLRRLALKAIRCSGLFSALAWPAPALCAVTAVALSLRVDRAAAAPDVPVASSAAAPASLDAATAPANSSSAPPAVDPDGTLIALGHELELVVTELGPSMPWTLHVHNHGSTPIGLMADPGLLWFEVAVPGTATPQVCRLPEPLWPKGMRRRAEVILPAGQRFSRRFDPRFFCFSDRVQTALVPGARVIPHFGWPYEVRSSVVNGKRVDQNLSPKAPFVAWSLQNVPANPAEPPRPPNPDTDDSNLAEPSPETPWQPPTEGLKNIVGTAIVLSPAYAKWSERAPAPTDGLQLAMLAGSDAEDERGAMVTVGLGNAGDAAQLVLVRRELLSFDVLGPDGKFECPTLDIGPPDSDSFTNLGVRASEQLVVRLIEVCPRGGFSRPGLYEVRSTWHGKFPAQASGIDAFVGTVASPRPALVRVRSGERSSFLRAAPMVATGEAGAVTGPMPGGPSPIDNPPSDGPGDDAPGERDNAPGAPDDGPAAEPVAPPENTSVE